MSTSGESPEPYVPAATIAAVAGTHHRRVVQWAREGLIRAQQIGGARRKYSLPDAQRLIANSEAEGTNT